MSVAVVLKNFTRHVIRADARALGNTSALVADTADHPSAMIHVEVVLSEPPGHVDPLLADLTALKAVFQDLLQEKLVGLKVYSVSFGSEHHWEIFLTPEAAMAHCDEAVGEKLPFVHDVSDETAWFSGTHDWVVTQHVIT